VKELIERLNKLAKEMDELMCEIKCAQKSVDEKLAALRKETEDET